MKAIEIRNFEDKHWKLFAGLSDNISQRFYSQKFRGVTDWHELRKIKTDEKVTYDIRTYLIMDNEIPVGWAYYVVMGSGSLDFDFDTSFEKVPKEFIRNILQLAIEFMNEKNVNEISSEVEGSRLLNPLLDLGAEILDEKIYSRLCKHEINIDDLKLIVAETEEKIPYKLRLFDNITEEITDRYIEILNETKADKELNNPVKKKITPMTREFLRKFMQYTKGQNDLMYMYMLFDGEKIAAFCSLFVREEESHVINHGGGLTAVAREYRGQNLARYLKAKMYLLMLEKHPDFEFIKTDTYPWNTYMYKINEQMGFKTFEKFTQIKINKYSIENYLNNISELNRTAS